MEKDIRKNAGYVITESLHIGKTEFVLGESDTQPARFVTWECNNGNNYFWGHYMDDRFSAERDLLERAKDELDRQASFRSPENKEKAKKHKETEMER